jgi:hypothetical protein
VPNVGTPQTAHASSGAVRSRGRCCSLDRGHACVLPDCHQVQALGGCAPALSNSALVPSSSKSCAAAASVGVFGYCANDALLIDAVAADDARRRSSSSSRNGGISSVTVAAAATRQCIGGGGSFSSGFREQQWSAAAARSEAPAILEPRPAEAPQDQRIAGMRAWQSLRSNGARLPVEQRQKAASIGCVICRAVWG